MALRSVLTILALSTVLAVPALAQAFDRLRPAPSTVEGQQRERHRPNDNDNRREETERARAEAAPRDRAVARTTPRPEAQSRQDPDRQEQARAAQRRADDNRRYDNGRNYDNNRSYSNNGRYDSRGYGYGARRYDSRNRYYYYYPGPRVIHPTVVHVVPYRPYVYRPSYSIGVFYGSGGYYPYGYTPSYYYQPVPGRVYGGVRITGAPRDARVFADGYFVGIVNDFDGIFQHLNLEAGRHHIEIDWGGYQPIAFDVYVRPGETTTFNAGGYFRY